MMEQRGGRRGRGMRRGGRARIMATVLVLAGPDDF